MDANQYQDQALTEINAAATLDALEALRVQWMGKKGTLTDALKALKDLPVEEKKTQGAALNKVKQAIAQAIGAKQVELQSAALEAQLAEEFTDLSLPARPEQQGSLHPITQVMDEIVAIFGQLGFQVAHGPDIEDDFHNFTALNIPSHHPARQMHDTFYLKAQEGEDAPVLRTHTSPVQVRAMRNGKPPFRVIAPGSTFRCDSDATHTPMFHQVEGLVIDKNIHMGHLKGTLSAFLKAFFGLESVPMRFRNSYFPFTEPSAEVDIACKKTKEGVLIGEGDDWLEILGCGMVHPNVLKACDLDPNEWQGFAFGMGIERLAMLKYGMADLRPFYESDLRWLAHYGFSPSHRPTLPWGLVA